MNGFQTGESIVGCLLGTAVGDALGLPSERMSRRRIAARWNRLEHRFILGRGMLSDDTEHTLMVAAALGAHRDDVVAFQRAFSWKLRWWLLALPAGVGLATAKAIVRLWVGFPATKSGVCSAGNGAAMRSAIIGVLWRGDPVKRREFALASTRVTHTDARAVEAALMTAEAAALASMKAAQEDVLRVLAPFVQSDEMRERFEQLRVGLNDGRSVAEYAESIGCGEGVSGFAPNTVAVALYAWLRHRGEYAEAVRAVIACGGDTDTVAAITGGICGAEVGEGGIPKEWIDGICDWPRSVKHIRSLARAVASEQGRAPRLFWPVVLARNLVFLIIVLGHGFRRLVPPYG